MNKLILLELKQKLKNKKTWVIFTISIITSILVTIFSMNSDREMIINKDGVVEYKSGIETIKYLKETQKELEGYITPEFLVDIVEDYTNIVNQYDGLNTNIPEDIYAKEITPISNILDIASYSFMTGYNGEFDKNGLFPKDFSPNLASNTYEKRYDAQNSLLSKKIKANDSLLETIEKRELKVNKPFYFSSYIGWDSLEKNYSLLLIPIITLLAIILVAPTFSKEYESGSDKVLRSTKLGRSILAKAKIISNVITAIILYSSSIAISMIIACTVFNVGGLNTSIQFVNLFSSTSLTIGQHLGISILCGMLTVVTMACFTLLLSASMKSSVMVLANSFMLVVINNIFNIMSANNEGNNILYFIVNAFSPFGGSTVSTSILLNNYLSIANLNVWLPYATLIISLVLLALFYKYTIKNYCNHQ
ncbi:MAG: ABC transporter permease subunit [Paraclostridium sp.]